MSKFDAKYQNTSAKMIAAMTSLLRQKHFQEITVTDVCREAGVQRSTFYAHYANTAELLQEAVETAIRDFNSYWKESSLEEMTFPYLTEQNLRTMLTYVEANREITRVFFQGEFPTLKRMIIDWIRDNMTLPHIIVGDRVRAEYITRYYLASVKAVIAAWLERDCAESIDEICEILLVCVNRKLPE